MALTRALETFAGVEREEEPAEEDGAGPADRPDAGPPDTRGDPAAAQPVAA